MILKKILSVIAGLSLFYSASAAALAGVPTGAFIEFTRDFYQLEGRYCFSFGASALIDAKNTSPDLCVTTPLGEEIHFTEDFIDPETGERELGTGDIQKCDSQPIDEWAERFPAGNYRFCDCDSQQQNCAAIAGNNGVLPPFAPLLLDEIDWQDLRTTICWEDAGVATYDFGLCSYNPETGSTAELLDEEISGSTCFRIPRGRLSKGEWYLLELTAESTNDSTVVVTFVAGEGPKVPGICAPDEDDTTPPAITCPGDIKVAVAARFPWTIPIPWCLTIVPAWRPPSVARLQALAFLSETQRSSALRRTRREIPIHASLR